MREKMKSFWYDDRAMPFWVGILSAGVFAGTHLFLTYGFGAFNDIAFLALLQTGIADDATGDIGIYAAAAFGLSFLFARVLEGSMVGILDIGGVVMTGVGIGLPATLFVLGVRAPLESFPLALLTGFLVGVLIGIVSAKLRKSSATGMKSTFGIDVMMGAGNQTGKFFGPLLILGAYGVSIPVGVGATVGALLFYVSKRPVELGAIVGGMFLGTLAAWLF